MEGASLYEVKDLLGHSSIEETQKYAHLAPENLKRAVSMLR
jgi:site-specific recombinase XerD